MAKQKGKVAQVIGPVIDVTFDLNDTSLPDIYDSLEITRENGDKLILECQQHIGEDTIRTISMESTDGISRGVEVTATGAPIKMPIGDAIKGRVFNVVGDAIDGMENLDNENGLPIHREAPKFEDLSTSTEVLFTGITVIDLIEPYAKGGKIGLIGGAGLGTAMISFIWSITHTSAAITLLCLAAMPFMTALLGFLFLKEIISTNVWVAIFTAAVGIVIICQPLQ